MTLRALIVDDERLARARLVRLLRRREDVEIAGVACDGDEAVEMLAELQPDLVFLDVQMPGLSGFDVLDAVSSRSNGNRMPAVVFTTAFDQYALRAFEVHALDYLLKPFDEERLSASLDRATAMIRGARADPGLRPFLEQMAPPERFVVRTPGRIVFLPLAEVDWIEAAGNYVYVHAGRERHLIRGTLKAIESRFAARFARIHRSAIVNLERVRELAPRAHGDCEVVLRGGARLPVSRTFAARLRALRH
jgi:two-component system, LytTR family, response regulator